MTIVEDLLPKPSNARTGEPIVQVRALVFHYPQVKRQRAKQVIAYWRERCHLLHATSANYVIDLDGVIYCAVPESEIAHHAGAGRKPDGSLEVDPVSRRVYTDEARTLFGDYASDPEHKSPNLVCIGIEMCHTDDAGTYTPATREAAIEFAVDRCAKYLLNPLVQITTHQRVVGYKPCPLYWVDHPDDFELFRRTINSRVFGPGGNAQSTPTMG